jgi:type I restriction enzyme S subunit
MARLEEICAINMGQSPDSSTYNEDGNGLPFFQGNADFGEIYPAVRMWCSEPTKIAQKKDILISVRAPIGALNIANCECCIGRGLAALTVNEDICAQEYLWHVLSGKVDELNSKGTGSTFKAINKKTLSETEIPLPPIDEQRKIAAILDKVSDLIAKRRQQLDKLDEMVKARFVEMFGDPVSNPYHWNIKGLLQLGDCKNGMNFHSTDVGVNIHCLGVGDFKNLSCISDTSKLPTISLADMPSDEYMLKDGDIVFVRSNGNKALVGRSLVVYPATIPTTFSGFCIRFRLHSDEVKVDYLLRVLKTDSIRKKMAGRGANIQNLNQKILGELQIPVPPLELQNQFTVFVEQTDKTRTIINHSLDKLEMLKKALMQEYFG